MTEEQFHALVDLIGKLSVLHAGIMQGSSNWTERWKEVVDEARAVLGTK